MKNTCNLWKLDPMKMLCHKVYKYVRARADLYWLTQTRSGPLLSSHTPQGSSRPIKWSEVEFSTDLPGKKVIYNMASSVSGQDKLNTALWLANWEGKLMLPSLLGFTCYVPQVTYRLSLFGQKAGNWPNSIIFLYVYGPWLHLGP